MKYKVAQFKITGPQELLQTARDLIAAVAGESGFESFEDCPQGVKGYVQADKFDRETLDNNLDTIPLPGVEVSYSIADAAYKDWNEEWEAAGFEPINIGQQIIVYDARHEAPPLPEKSISIAIAARQAFGSGTHDTTQQVLSALLNSRVAGKRVLDCGCGTGILGIAAAKLGACEVVGYDIDEWSVDNAKHNANINNINNIKILEGDATVLKNISGRFDVVMANINRNILLHDLPTFKDVMTTDGILILSGFYESDIPLLEKKGLELGLHKKSSTQQNGWCCLVMSAI